MAIDLNSDAKVLTTITAFMLIVLLTVGFIAYASGSSFRAYGANSSVTVTASSSYDRWIYVSGVISAAWITSAQATINVRNPSGLQILTSSITLNPMASTDSANFTAVLSSWVNGTYSATVIWANGTTSTSGTTLFAYGTVSAVTSSSTTSSTSLKSTTTIFVNRTTTVTSPTTISSITTSTTTSTSTATSTTTSTTTSTEPGKVTTITSTITQPASTVSSTTTSTLVRLNAIGITLAGIGVAIAIIAGGVSMVALRRHY